MTPEQQEANLKLIAEAAVKSEKLTGCPAELTAAQCILESGWLAYCPGQNCFGIKSFKGEYGRQLLDTWEVFTPSQLQQFLSQGDSRSAVSLGGNRYRVKDWFATFATLADCFTLRALMWNKGPYAPAGKVYESDDLPNRIETYVKSIAPIYATDPQYSEKILTLIHQPNVSSALEIARKSV